MLLSFEDDITAAQSKFSCSRLRWLFFFSRQEKFVPYSSVATKAIKPSAHLTASNVGCALLMFWAQKYVCVCVCVLCMNVCVSLTCWQSPGFLLFSTGRYFLTCNSPPWLTNTQRKLLKNSKALNSKWIYETFTSISIDILAVYYYSCT